jgi:hypothetical protein
MTKTMEALDLFARALPPASPSLEVGERAAMAPVGAPSVAGRAARATALTGYSDLGLAPRVEHPREADAVLPHLAASDYSPPRMDDGRTTPPAVAAGPVISGPRAPHAAESTRQRKSVVPVRSDGLTRRRSIAGWPQWIGLALVVATLGLGSRILVRASERAGEACWRQGAGKSFLHAHPHANAACQRSGSRAT